MKNRDNNITIKPELLYIRSAASPSTVSVSGSILEYFSPTASPGTPPAPLLLPCHPHPRASDSHPSSGGSSVGRLYVLVHPRSSRRSCRHRRPHRPGGSRLTGLPAALHARFVPHLGLGSGDRRETEKATTSIGGVCFYVAM